MLVGVVLILYNERTRTMQGVWMYKHEGSEFFEGEFPKNPCDIYLSEPGWFDYPINSQLPNYDYRKNYRSSGIYRAHGGAWRSEAFAISFQGRKKLSLLGTGHFGLWNSRFEVDKIISAEPIPDLDCEDKRVP
jgi:hypothetical protein